MQRVLRDDRARGLVLRSLTRTKELRRLRKRVARNEPRHERRQDRELESICLNPERLQDPRRKVAVLDDESVGSAYGGLRHQKQLLLQRRRGDVHGPDV